VQAQLVQTAQSAACNVKHELIQRLPRWLLLCSDRLESDLISLTHEFLGMMLGVRRTTVTVTAEALHDRGLIEYRRGKIRIVDRVRLEAAACECYAIVKEHLENYHMVETGFAV
jgi:CRP-like cAMP-binding protein